MNQLDLTKKYALAVSGGVDSMVMLHKFATLLPRPDFFVVTVNHHIREEAQSDCDFVANYCRQLGIDCIVLHADVPAFAKEKGISEETAARQLRYQLLDGLQCDYVCLAHHNDDNAETIVMHLLRGAGARGARGISRQNGRYIRPLLDLSRAQIEQYAKDNSVPFVVDQTNNQDKYARNYLRHNVMPLLSNVHANAQQNIVKFANRIAMDDDYLDSLADISTVQFQDNCAQVPVQLLTQHPSIAYRVIGKVVRQLGIFHDIEETHLKAIVELAQNVGGKKVVLPFDLVAVNDYNRITFFVEDNAVLQDFCLPFCVGSMTTPVGTLVVNNNQQGQLFNLDAIPADAVVRFAKQGDMFTKFGGGTKPLNRYLIDKKIPQRLRDKLVVVASGNNVLIIVGVEISNSLKVTDITKAHYISLHKE